MPDYEHPQFTDGKKAFHAGLGKDKNPYESGTVNHAQWDAGHDHAFNTLYDRPQSNELVF